MASRYQPGELRRRVITGFAGAILAVTAIAVNPIGMLLVFFVVSTAMYLEYLGLHGIERRRWDTALWLVLHVGVCLFWAYYDFVIRFLDWLFGKHEPAAYFDSLSVAVFWLLLLYPLTLLVQLFAFKNEQRMADSGHFLVGWVYTVLPFLLLCAAAVEGKHWVLSLGIIMQIWAADIAAYFGGKTFGKRLLLPRVSPNKTWEGAVAGALGALLLAACWYVLGPVVPYNWFVIAGIVAVFAPLGDLVESQLKRSAGVKDSGTLLPGHGGMLDRFDGFLITLPVIYLYLRLWVG